VLRARLATAAVAIPLLLLLILAGPDWGFSAFAVVLSALGVAEYASLAFAERRAQQALIVVIAIPLILAVASGVGTYIGAALSAAVVVGFVAVLLGRSDFEQGLRDLGIGLVGVLYVGFLLPHFALVHRLTPDGPYLVIYLIAVGMAGDTSGYFVGHSIGRHKLIPRVSPGKTVEGAVGIVLGSVAAGALAKPILLSGWSWSEAIGISAFLGVVGQFGDLSESIIKRTFGAKDSGRLFPGHGGILDRIDSLLFPVVFLYYHLSLSG
jgi:phosphatidate cytidylyltransferase